MEIFFFWLLCAILSAAILSGNNNAGTGFLLGAIFGPFGVLFALVMRSGKNKEMEQKRHEEQIQAMSSLNTSNNSNKPERECPFCAETILAKAKICKHCGKDLPELEVTETPTKKTTDCKVIENNDGTFSAYGEKFDTHEQAINYIAKLDGTI